MGNCSSSTATFDKYNLISRHAIEELDLQNGALMRVGKVNTSQIAVNPNLMTVKLNSIKRPLGYPYNTLKMSDATTAPLRKDFKPLFEQVQTSILNSHDTERVSQINFEEGKYVGRRIAVALLANIWSIEIPVVPLNPSLPATTNMKAGGAIDFWTNENMKKLAVIVPVKQGISPYFNDTASRNTYSPLDMNELNSLVKTSLLRNLHFVQVTRVTQEALTLALNDLHTLKTPASSAATAPDIPMGIPVGRETAGKFYGPSSSC